LARDWCAMLMATATKRWTLAEVHSLPDDGNKYELVRGELFVTPPPFPEHETISARLTRILDPYVEANRLGFVYRPRAVVRFEGSEVEPDLMVSQRIGTLGGDKAWNRAPTPILVVEVHSEYTRRRDKLQKRNLYMDAGVAEYWMIDPDRLTITAVRRDAADVVFTTEVTWSPPGVSAPLTFDVARIFDWSSSA
ncbi:MAG: Uma2 family endonuclease, partial [Gemmatimonadaceae bacterium]